MYSSPQKTQATNVNSKLTVKLTVSVLKLYVGSVRSLMACHVDSVTAASQMSPTSTNLGK